MQRENQVKYNGRICQPNQTSCQYYQSKYLAIKTVAAGLDKLVLGNTTGKKIFHITVTDLPDATPSSRERERDRE